MCGTIEEKMYARQVQKCVVTQKVIENRDITKHFSRYELRELFLLGDPQHSSMRQNIAVRKGRLYEG